MATTAYAQDYVQISYSGPDVGPIYLADVGARYQLAGGLYNRIGQDIVINKGDVITLVKTSEVAMSIEKGSLKKYGTDDYFTAAKDNRFIQGLLFSGKITVGDLTVSGGLEKSLVVLASDTRPADTRASVTAGNAKHGTIPSIGEF